MTVLNIYDTDGGNLFLMSLDGLGEDVQSSDLTTTKIEFVDSDGYTDRFDGYGFTYQTEGDTTRPTAGTITGYTGSDRSGTLVEFSDFTMSITDFLVYVDESDDYGFFADIFSEADLVNGGSGDDIVVTFDGDDTLYGNGGDDTFIGGDGSDYIEGGAGGDLLVGDLDETLIAVLDSFYLP